MLTARGIIITGGAREMGAGLVRALPRLGTRIISMDRSPEGRTIAEQAGAVIAWSRSIARKWAVHNIRVNAVAPAIWTLMYETTCADARTAHAARLGDEVGDPLSGKLGWPISTIGSSSEGRRAPSIMRQRVGLTVAASPNWSASGSYYRLAA